MAKLIEVDIADIAPNPFRDIEIYPFDEVKIARLVESINSTGFWPSVIVRKASAGYECAFGHHRLHAAKQAGLTVAHVVLQDLTDDEMLRMMVDENSTEYGHDFYTTLNSVSAVVRAYGKGAIELDFVEPGQRGVTPTQMRYAPSFIMGAAPEQRRGYTGLTVARYLKWIDARSKGEKGEQPKNRVLIALSALELIERKVLTIEQFRGTTQTAAALLVKVTTARMRAERADIDATIKVRNDALRLAEKAGDTNKAETLKASIEDMEEEAAKKAAKAGRAAAKAVAEDLKPKSPKEVAEKAAPKAVDTETRVVKTATQVLYDLIAKWEVTCLELDPKWEKAGDATPTSKKAARVALLALSERAKNRAEEV